jgi:regulator of nucleoside diphosphate kinase
MNSRFSALDLRTGEIANYRLVYPEDELSGDDALCVLSPMGMAMLGAREGEIVRWSGAAGPRAMQVVRLSYQPEAAGDHDL